jgi:ArsR family transcriptional regulator
MSILTATDQLDQARRIGRALADPGRLRILAALGRGELCVCHLVELLGLDQSTVSRHVAVLRDAGLVRQRREGRWVHYRRSSGDARVAALLVAVDGLLEGAPELEADAGSLCSISQPLDGGDPCGESAPAEEDHRGGSG